MRSRASAVSAALNNAHAQELSWLEAERLEYLVGEAFLARRIGKVDAFLLAFDQDARYDSPNFIWFRARYPRFVYVDRIVVAPDLRGIGGTSAPTQDWRKETLARDIHAFIRAAAGDCRRGGRIDTGLIRSCFGCAHAAHRVLDGGRG